MKLIRNSVLLLVVSMLLYACDREGHPNITIVNHSERDIAVQLQYPSYPVYTELDSMFQCYDGATCISSDSQMFYPSNSRPDGGVWEDYFNNRKYLQFLVVDCDTYWKYHSEPCDTIHKYVPVLHVYRLTLEDLEGMNWTVVYPPEE